VQLIDAGEQCRGRYVFHDGIGEASRRRLGNRAAPMAGNARQAATRIEVYTERRRAYQDAFKALSEIRPGAGGPGDVRSIPLAKDEVARVQSALKLIYETTQHGGHDISDGRDWATIEGEAETALTILTEAGKGGS